MIRTAKFLAVVVFAYIMGAPLPLSATTLSDWQYD
jgi:hypothetical protein